MGNRLVVFGLLLLAVAAAQGQEQEPPADRTPPAGHRVETLADGRARLPAPVQAIEAEAAPAGIIVRSTARGERGTFTLRAVEIGRTGSPTEKVSAGRVIIEGATVHIFRPNFSEELTTSAEGVRQDFVISAAPGGRGELQLVLQAQGARVSAKGEAISLTLPGGRELLYHELKATDSEGRVLPARFEPDGEDRVRIGVDDRGARYPLRIDPTLADGEWSVIAAAPSGG